MSTVTRNGLYLHLPKYTGPMSSGERAANLGHFEVMMLDVKAKSDVGEIPLGLRHEGAQRLKSDRHHRYMCSIRIHCSVLR